MISWPVSTSVTSIASPTAQMCGSPVRISASTAMPPRGPSASPAACASAVSGRTPMARITRSASMPRPDSVRTMRPPLAVGSNPDSPSPRWRVTPCASRCSRTGSAISASSGGITCGSFSRIVTCRSRRARFSAISRPMKPPPTTTARAGRRASIQCRMRSESGMVPHREDARQIDAGQRRTHRRRARREHQRIVGLVAVGAVLVEGAHADRAARPVDRRHLMARLHADVEALLKEIGGRHQQAALLGNDVADEVRQPAIRERDVRPAVEQHDLRLFVEAAEARRARRAAGHPAHDQDPFGHG
jgi:hypothetical protein